ncbi:MAG: RagB/SusD family nutrient uptake outer membrane protein [Balneolales bacterium]
MKIDKIFLAMLGLIFIMPACDLLEPETIINTDLERVKNDPELAEGLVQTAYTQIPTNDYRWDEVATDDAVTNDQFSGYMRMATGEWTSLYNPQNIWDNSNRAILYVNQFLEVVDEVPFKWTNEKQNELFKRRLSGEAYLMRGLHKYFLLRNHGGMGSNGQMLGIQIYNDFLEADGDFQKARAGFTESVESAYDDLDEAIARLPMDYGNISDLSELESGFADVDDVDNYNQVFGNAMKQKASARIAKAFKARLALLAASPAFNENNDSGLWETAADYTAELLDDIGDISGIDPTGHTFYMGDQVDGVDVSNNDIMAEILWRRPYYTNNARESSNFPPSIHGNGRINPTQDLVDAFPMANGYPIDDANSNFDESDPYTNRDPRLSLYIVYNGSTMRGETINTTSGGGDDGLDNMEYSTRTGYYMKKLLREDVNVDPASSSSQRHFNTHIRYTELFLNYAEAANEAWGPDASPGHTYTAKDVIRALRERAGIEQPDNYLSSINNQDDMRELIRNERRLELSFESHRFWDLRRWDENLSAPATGVRIENGNYTIFDVERRDYNDYMKYGPIPGNEVSRFGVTQNEGWN